MSKNKILVPIDFKQDSTALLKYASSIARSIHARITCVHVMTETVNDRRVYNNIANSSYVKKRRSIELMLADTVNGALKNDKVAYEIIVTKGVFHQQINILAREFNATLIIMNRNGTANFIQVADQATIPVIAISGNKYLTCKNIIFPLNIKSPYSVQMYKVAEIASLLNANITILFCDCDQTTKYEEEFKADLKKIKGLLEKDNISSVTRCCEESESMNSILESWAIDGDADMLILFDREQIRLLDSQISENGKDIDSFGLPVLFLSIKENKSTAKEANENAHYN